MRGWEEGLIPLVMWTWEDGPSVEQDLDDLVVVGVGGQDEGGDVGREGGSVGGDRLPALVSASLMMMVLMIRIHNYIKYIRYGYFTQGSPSL